MFQMLKELVKLFKTDYIQYTNNRKKYRNATPIKVKLVFLMLFILAFLYQVSSFDISALKKGYYSILFNPKTDEQVWVNSYLSSIESNNQDPWTQVDSSVSNYEFIRDKFKEYSSYVKGFAVTDDMSQKLLLVSNDGFIDESFTWGNNTIDKEVNSEFVRIVSNDSGKSNFAAQFYYANYGREEDYEKLNAKGVHLQEKVAIVRSGKIDRNLKIEYAKKSGALGLLIYIDPYDKAEVESSDDYKMINSHLNISLILSSLKGEGFDCEVDMGDEWVGSLPGLDYFVGPSTGSRLSFIDSSLNHTVHKDIFATIQGAEKNDVIIIGSHRGDELNSGSLVMLQVIKSLQELQKNGWTPLRTLVFVSWYGGQHDTASSEKWLEVYRLQFQKDIMAYINIDGVFGSQLNIASSALLNNILKESAKSMSHSTGDSSSFGQNEINFGNLPANTHSSSFFDNLGIPSANIGFSDIESSEPISDSDYNYHKELSKYIGIFLLKLGDIEVAQFKVEEYSNQISSSYKELIQNIPKEWNDVRIQVDLNDDDAAATGKISPIYNIGKYINIDEFWRLKKQVTTPENIAKHKMNAQKSHKMKFENLTEITATVLARFCEVAKRVDNLSYNLQEQFQISSELSFYGKLKLITNIQLINLKLKYLERNFLHQVDQSDEGSVKDMIYCSSGHKLTEPKFLPYLRDAFEKNDFEGAVYWMTNLLKATRRVSTVLNMEIIY